MSHRSHLFGFRRQTSKQIIHFQLQCIFIFIYSYNTTDYNFCWRFRIVFHLIIFYIFQLKFDLGGGSKVPDYGSLELHNMAADNSIKMNSLSASSSSSAICCQMLPRTSKLARVKHWLQSKVKNIRVNWSFIWSN